MCMEMLARVVSVDAGTATAVVDDSRRLHRISLALLALQGETVSGGDWLIVHTGLAVARVAADDAKRSATR